MSTTFRDVYTDVCRVLLEDAGLSIVSSEADFLAYCKDAIDLFLSETGCIQGITAIPGHVGISEYTIPDSAGNITTAFHDDSHLEHSSGFFLDNSDPEWETRRDAPQRYREDHLESKQIELSPAPNTQGRQVLSEPAMGFYGAISSTSDVTDFDFTCPAGLYGTISSFGGDVYLDPAGVFYGTIAAMVGSPSNVAVVASKLQYWDTVTLDSVIEFVPDTASQYLKYYVLENIFSQDGEAKDLSKVYFCRARRIECVNAFKAIMSEPITEQMEMK